MKENPDIDELLNGFIDGELTARQTTEVQRLIDHDAEIAARLRKLQRCKILVGSMPLDRAPAGLAEDIKAALERRTLLAQPPQFSSERRGAKHLLVRKVLSAAAMFGLVAALAVVIYTIVGPGSITDAPIAGKYQPPSAGKTELPEPAPQLLATAQKPSIEDSIATKQFNGTLELKTGDLPAVVAVIRKAIADNGLLENVSPIAQEHKNGYTLGTLSCSREALGLLLADLESVWPKLDSATLFIESQNTAGRVVVNAVTVEQIARIAGQESTGKRIALAKDFASKNIAEKTIAKNDSTPELIPIPKPRLTQPEETIKKLTRTEDAQKVHLTIVLIGHK